MCHYRNVHSILSRAITNICWFYISLYTFQINSRQNVSPYGPHTIISTPCHSTAKGLFSRDVRCRKRPRSESPAKGEAEKAMKRQLENNKNWMKFWIKSIPFPEKLDQIDIHFYPLSRHVAAVGVFDQSMELFTSRLQYDGPKCWLWNRGLWCSRVSGVNYAMKHYS